LSEKAIAEKAAKVKNQNEQCGRAVHVVGSGGYVSRSWRAVGVCRKEEGEGGGIGLFIVQLALRQVYHPSRGQARSSLSFWPSTSFPKWTTKSSPTAAQVPRRATQESCVQTDPAFLKTVVRANSDTHLTVGTPPPPSLPHPSRTYVVS